MKDDKKAHDAYAAAKKEENARFFDRWSAGYDNFVFAWWMHHLQKKAVAELPPLSEGKLLEVGFGTGMLISSLSKKFRGRMRITGVDISPEMLKKAGAKLRGLPSVELMIADAEKLPFKSGTFDFVVSTLAVHHFPNALKAIKEMCRVLKKGGRLVVVDADFFLPAVNSIAKLIEPGFVRMHTKKEFKCMFEMAGVLPVKQKRVGLFAILNVAVKIRQPKLAATSIYPARAKKPRKFEPA